jgi:hypothetical protein
MRSGSKGHVGRASHRARARRRARPCRRARQPGRLILNPDPQSQGHTLTRAQCASETGRRTSSMSSCRATCEGRGPGGKATYDARRTRCFGLKPTVVGARPPRASRAPSSNSRPQLRASNPGGRHRSPSCRDIEGRRGRTCDRSFGFRIVACDRQGGAWCGARSFFADAAVTRSAAGRRTTMTGRHCSDHGRAHSGDRTTPAADCRSERVNRTQEVVCRGLQIQEEGRGRVSQDENRRTTGGG